MIGVTMQIWQDEDQAIQEENGGCCGLSAVDDARRVAERLEIPYYVMNFKDIFREKVMDNFVDEYYAGHTPDPCIRCNRYVKWEALLKRATGYWCRLYCHRSLCEGDSVREWSLRTPQESPNATRTYQTYALYNLTQEQLSHTLMPVGA